MSSSSCPIAEFIKVLNIVAKKSQVTVQQVPQEIGMLMAANTPFEYQSRIRCTSPHTYRQMHAFVLYNDFFYDYSTSDDVYVHRRGLAFLRFANQSLYWKESVFHVDQQDQLDAMYRKLCNQVLMADLVNYVVNCVVN